MGRHTALDEDVVHPLVAEALRRRNQAEAPNVVAALPVPTPSSTAVGWPGDPGRGDGLGWPGDGQPVRDAVAPDSGHPDDDGSVLAALDAAAGSADGPSAGVPRRSGWRRFFGGGHTPIRPGSSAA